MDVKIEPKWKVILQEEFEKPYFHQLAEFVKNEYRTQVIFPPAKDIFAAFNHVSFDDVKVVILGQDPYHGPGQANGLCFSVHDGVAFPPSLQNIFREIQSDLGKPIPTTGNLERWAKQGVLLLNSVLTVRQGMADSHKSSGWETFTDAVIEKLSQHRNGLVFMLWGGKAHKKGAKIDTIKHLVLKSGHPSPLSANKGHWFGNRHFSQANIYLRQNNQTPIVW